MTDPRVALRGSLARWLRVRANVRAIAAKLAAGQAALRRDARRNDDPDMAVLFAQLACEQSAIDALAHDLDYRISGLNGEYATAEASFLARVVGAAQGARPGRASLREGRGGDPAR